MHSQISFTPCQYPQITLRKLAQLLKVYNTNWSEGAIAGVLTDMVKEIREQTLMGNSHYGGSQCAQWAEASFFIR